MLLSRVRRSRVGVLLALVGLTATAVACAGGDGGGGSSEQDTVVFGAASDPVTLDGAFVTDGESMRPVLQIFETLVTHEPGGTKIVPQLAKEWETSEDGKTWTFQLQPDVKFTDGTALDAKAVCTNFDRWYNFTDLVQQVSASYFEILFGAFADKPKDSNYDGCVADGDSTVRLRLKTPNSSLLAALTLPAFSIASPAALEKYDADKVGGSPDQPQFESSFGQENPVGSGPYELKSWTRGDRLVLVRNDDYWGEKAKVSQVILRPIPDNAARRQALETGDIDGYEDVPPGDVGPLRENGYQLVERPAFTVAYIGFNQKKKPLDNVKIRQAIAYALNKEALVKAKYGPGATVAKEFMPKGLFGYADDVPTYDYDPEKAKQLVKESGVANPTLEFWYPTAVNRSYMPDPRGNFQAFKRDLEAVGFTVRPKTAPWDAGYLTARSGGKAPMSLSGWIADFPDPDNFLGTFFLSTDPGAMRAGADVERLLREARQETNKVRRTAMYQEANRLIMKRVPGVPYASTGSVVALDERVQGLRMGPVGGPSYEDVTVG